MAQLKGVIFGVRDVLVRQGTLDRSLYQQIGQLVQYLAKHGIQCVAICNSKWHATYDNTNEHTPFQEALRESWGLDIPCFACGEDGFPPKQTAAALERIRSEMHWKANETLYIGNSKDDMQSAVNGKTLFLNALWYGDNTKYGFRLKSPREIARFIDIFCLREHWWFFAVESDALRVYCLAPFSTYANPDWKNHSDNFIRTVKERLGEQEDVEFWAKYLCTSLYFSGVYDCVNYITPYPGHRRDSFAPVLAEPMSVFAKCFRRKFIPNMVIRHTDAPESKRHRDSACHKNQLDTIRLKRHPDKYPGKPFANSPLGRGKTVLVLDDIVTEGYSLEAARTFIEATGAKVIGIGLLKTLNRDYHQAKVLGFVRSGHDPYTKCEFDTIDIEKKFLYHTHIADYDAAADLSRRLERYKNWTWPDNSG